MHYRRIVFALLAIAALVAFCAPVFAQSLLSGDVAGTVTDPTGAVIPNASVTLKSLDTGAVQTTTTTAGGSYRFTLLKPGRYQVTANQTGFQNAERQVSVQVGSVATADLTMEV